MKRNVNPLACFILMCVLTACKDKPAEEPVEPGNGETSAQALPSLADGTSESPIQGEHHQRETQRSAPILLAAAQGITFSDRDFDEREIAGDIEVKRADDELNITHYRVYWMTLRSRDITDRILLAEAEKPAGDGATLTITIPEDTKVPKGAVGFWLVSANKPLEVESLGIYATYRDAYAEKPIPQAISAFFIDVDGEVGKIAGQVKVRHAVQSRGVDGIRLLWADAQGEVLTELPEIARLTFSNRGKIVANEDSYSAINVAPVNIPNGAQMIFVSSFSANPYLVEGRAIPIFDRSGNYNITAKGGNSNLGAYEYGGIFNEVYLPSLDITREEEGNAKAGRCTFSNGIVTAIDGSDLSVAEGRELDNLVDNSLSAFNFQCDDAGISVAKEDVLYQASDEDPVGFPREVSYGPLNDAYYFANLTHDMFMSYVHEPPVDDDIKIVTGVSAFATNALWYNGYVLVGSSGIFPRESLAPVLLDVVAHEIAHGFFEKYVGNEALTEDMKAVNEGFADIVGEVAEYYAYQQGLWPHSADWLHGAYLSPSFVEPNQPGRLVSFPSFNSSHSFSEAGANSYPAEVSDPHLAGGIVTKAFYALVDPDGLHYRQLQWTIPKAFKAFAYANKYCWRGVSTLPEAAQCVLDQAEKISVDFNAECAYTQESSSCLSLQEKISYDIVQAFAQVDIFLSPVGVSGPMGLFSFEVLESDESSVRVSLLDRSFCDDCEVDTWLWSFTKEHTSSEKNPTFVFERGKHYWVSLTVSSSSQIQDEFIRWVYFH